MANSYTPIYNILSVAVLSLAAFACFDGFASSAPVQRPDPFQAEHSPDQILVKPKLGVAPAALAVFHAAHNTGIQSEFPRFGGVQVLRVPAGETVPGLIAKYQQSGLVEYAEPDYVYHLDATMPNDPAFTNGTLWALYNYGQNSGTAGADINAVNAWDIRTSASNIVVAILDSGVRYTHQDLAANIWSNPVDGTHGINAVAGTSDPMDDYGHGTQMAGVLGAVGNNGLGVVGVAWQVQMMACKCFNSSGAATSAEILACVDFACTNGAQIMNASFDSTGFSQSLSNAIYATREAGIIFVASAGNTTPSGINVDVTPHYPACYQIDNIVSVAYTTRNDTLGAFSDYGPTNIALAAPGDQIYSTFNASDSSYFPPSNSIDEAGTSFAAAYVSGALALMLAQYPGQSYPEIISLLLSATDPVAALAGKCRTGGRLNLRKALNRPLLSAIAASPGSPPQFLFRVSAGTNRTCVIQATTPDFSSWTPVFTNTTAGAGYFEFTNLSLSGSSSQFYRVSCAP